MGAQWKQKSRTENAAAKGRIFGKLVKEIMVAAKAGANPGKNSRLRVAIEQAKKASMPRDTLDRAIQKGAGLLDGPVHFDLVTYEGFCPHQVPVMVECLTDNKTRTAANIRMIFRRGQLASEGAVSWDFKHQGLVEAAPPPEGADAETAAIEAGAQDLEPAEDGATRFYTEHGDLDLVTRALTAQKWTVHTSQLVWRPKSSVKLDASSRAEVERFLEALDDDDDVQHIYAALDG